MPVEPVRSRESSVDIPLPSPRPALRLPGAGELTLTTGRPSAASCQSHASPGNCVDRVRFVDRVDGSELTGALHSLDRVVSSEPVLLRRSPTLARDIADRYAGTLTDVLRLAVPPRHARVEKEIPPERAGTPSLTFDVPAGWGRYPAGASWLRALREGRSPRAVWSALPGEDWPRRYAEAAATALAGGRGAVMIVADFRDLDRLDEAVTDLLGSKDHHVALSAALGPSERYRRFLAASRGAVRLVLGTRAAAFAPVPDLGLVAIWDDGDDLHAEPHAPYPARTRGPASPRGTVRRRRPARGIRAEYRQSAADRDRAGRGSWSPPGTPCGPAPRESSPPAMTTRWPATRRPPRRGCPASAWKAARDALAGGAPVLVQVPRRGYLPAVRCSRCGESCRCQHCHGPLSLPSATSPLTCRWCARPEAAYSCRICGARALRAAVTGARRTAEELARAFPGTRVRTSGRDEVLTAVPAKPALVVCTPGAEPVAAGGYGAVLLLDTWALADPGGSAGRGGGPASMDGGGCPRPVGPEGGPWSSSVTGGSRPYRPSCGLTRPGTLPENSPSEGNSGSPRPRE